MGLGVPVEIIAVCVPSRLIFREGHDVLELIAVQSNFSFNTVAVPPREAITIRFFLSFLYCFDDLSSCT